MLSRDTIKTCESLKGILGVLTATQLCIFGYLGWYLDLLLRSKCTYAVYSLNKFSQLSDV